jgi:hypothetical protein
MTLTTDQKSSSTVGLPQAVSEVVATFKSLSVDDQLALLSMVHLHLGSSLTPIAPGAARIFLTQGLLHRIKQISHTEQLSVLRDLLAGADTPITRQYGMFPPKTKLAFWSQLFEWMYSGEVINVSTGYELSPARLQIYKKIASLDLEEQMIVVRQLVVDMGVDPIAA